MFNLSIQNLLRHRIRSFLTMLGIAAAIGVLFSIFSFNRGFEKGLERELQATGLHFMITTGCPHELASLVLHGSVSPNFLDTGVMETIRDIDGISLITPILVAQLPNPDRQRIDLIYGVDMDLLPKIKPEWEITGRMANTPYEILVGYSLAKHDNIEPGAEFRYPNLDTVFIVSGTIQQTSTQDDAFIFMPIATAQKLLNSPQRATAIGVKVDQPERMAAIIAEIKKTNPGIQTTTINQVMTVVTDLAASAKSLSLAIALVALIIGAVGVMNSIMMAVFERSQEIGMMRAIGASRWNIIRIILQETTILTVIGGVTGIVIATLGGQLIENFIRQTMPYVPSGDMLLFDPVLAAACVLFAVGIGLVAGLYPAGKAAQISPIAAIRG